MRSDDVNTACTQRKTDLSRSRLPLRRRLVFVAIIAVAVLAFLAVSGELLVRFFNPRASLYPRFKYSAAYGAALYENTVMVHTLPGQYRYEYTINEYGYRGKAIPISNRYELGNVVVLGDSYSFGSGVRDGEEYSAVMQGVLGHDYNVINLGVGGYGLTQEIRRFYEFGRLYDPQVVILQFCGNDPSDNLYNKVTELDHSRFVFRDTKNSIAWTKEYLSRSILQKSQLYNFAREGIYAIVNKRDLVEARARLETGAKPVGVSPPTAEENFYDELLRAFAGDLKERGIRFMMISVNGELDAFPAISETVKKLGSDGLVEYVDVLPWFEGVTDYASPEGHSWGAKGHAIVGRNLAQRILRR